VFFAKKPGFSEYFEQEILSESPKSFDVPELRVKTDICGVLPMQVSSKKCYKSTPECETFYEKWTWV